MTLLRQRVHSGGIQSPASILSFAKTEILATWHNYPLTRLGRRKRKTGIRKMSNKKFVTGALLLLPLFSLNSVAQLSGDAAAKAVADRQALFKQIADANAPLGAMARPGGVYNAEAALKAVDTIASLAGKIPAAFVPNTTGYKQPNPGKYAANDSIWSSKADFDKLAADAVAGAKQARELLSAQGAAGLRPALQAIGQKCGACHDRYRVDL
jgi:cytochrome c556